MARCVQPSGLPTSTAISPAEGDVEVPSGGDHSRMIKQSQVRSVLRIRPVRPVALVKTPAAVLIAGAAVTLAACSSGTNSSSAGNTAAPRTTSAATGPSTHSGSPMASAGSHTASPGSHTASPGSHTASPGSHTGSPASPMANKSTCKHVDSLRTSLQNLSHQQLNAGSASKLRTDLANIEKQLAALKSQGGNSALSSQVKQLSTSVDQVKKAANGLSTPPTTAQVTAIVTSLTQLKAQAKPALTEMNAACPK